MTPLPATQKTRGQGGSFLNRGGFLRVSGARKGGLAGSANWFFLGNKVAQVESPICIYPIHIHFLVACQKKDIDLFAKKKSKGSTSPYMTSSKCYISGVHIGVRPLGKSPTVCDHGGACW